MNSRLDLRDKQRKINKLYNISITIVSVLIVIVAITIFTGNGVKQTSKETKQTTLHEATTKENSENIVKTKVDRPISEEPKKEETDSAQTELVKIEGSGDGNVLNTYTSESWQPVGTEQTSPHATNFEKGSADWNEMTKAIAYGAGMDEGSMRLWWLKNGGSPNTAIGTVSAGEDSRAYRVYIEWVEGAGWKPVKVEELKENDKGR